MNMKKWIALIMSMIMAFSMNITTVLADSISTEIITLEEFDLNHDKVRELQNQLSHLQMLKYEQENTGIVEIPIEKIEAQIKIIEDKLIELGVREVSICDLDFVALPEGVTVPSTTNERWSLEESTVTYDGVKYKISVLTAQSKKKASTLFDNGAKVLHAAPGLKASVADYIRIAATAASGTVGTVVGSIYDAISSTISNLSKSTVIEDIEASYTWQCDTIMHFVYVKKASASGNPKLCYVYNEVNTNVVGVTDNVQFNSKGYNNLDFDIYRAKTTGTMSKNANHPSKAVNSYLNSSQIMHSFVDYEKITGVGGKTIIKNYVCKVTGPGMIY